MRVLYVGRFQPFHRGHLAAVRHILRKDGAEVVVGIGSSQESHNPRNPFTAGERHLMIARALSADGLLPRAFITNIPDIHNHGLWVAHVESLVPPFEAVFTNARLDRRLFAEKGYRVLPEFFAKRSTWSGTEVRRRMVDGGDWHSLVPGAVASLVRAHHGVARVRQVAGAAADSAALTRRRPAPRPGS